MDQLRMKRQEIAAQAKGITDNARAAVRALTEDEKKSIDGLLAQAADLDAQIKAADEQQARLDAVGALFGGSDAPVTPGATESKSDDDRRPMTVGEHFVKSLQKSGHRGLRKGMEFGAPEVDIKANTDVVNTGGPEGFWGPWLTDRQMTGGVRPVREQPVVGDLIQWASTSAQLIEYLEYPPSLLEGSAGFVFEGGTKPQVSIGEPVWRQDPVREVAAWFTLTDDALEDTPFIASEIDRELRYNFADVESKAILRGDGVAPGLKGILNRSGVQHMAGGSDPAVLADNLFRALQSVQTASGHAADGIVINPQDYMKLRLMKDANGQYFAGGIFGGNYGSTGHLQWTMPLWGVRTVISNTAEVGKPIVGAWKAGATGYRKGGLKVEATNSHIDNFTNDRVTIRMREKVGLAVRYPSAFVVLDQAAA